MTFVVDASVIVKWYVPEEHSEDAELLLKYQSDLHAPEIAIAELGNILWKKCLIGELDDHEAIEIVDAFLLRDISYHSQHSLIRVAVERAIATGQAVHDWTYLALALSLDIPFVTADRRFFRAIRQTSFKKNIVWVEQLATLL